MSSDGEAGADDGGKSQSQGEGEAVEGGVISAGSTGRETPMDSVTVARGEPEEGSVMDSLGRMRGEGVSPQTSSTGGGAETNVDAGAREGATEETETEETVSAMEEATVPKREDLSLTREAW